jgi:AcrR family transcriptional regulator
MRLLDAATEEFAAHGIAGARVDRIAAMAECNKNLIYVHFGNKEQLFQAAFERAGRMLLESIPFNAYDLPGYASALFDFALARPDLVRLAQWRSLELRPDLIDSPLAVASMQSKAQSLSEAQAAGAIDDTLTPEILLALVLCIAGAFSQAGMHSLDRPDQANNETKRRAVGLAVARLTEIAHRGDRPAPTSK